MLKKTINFFRGSVRVEVSGPFPERFLNLCAQRGVAFWGVDWLENGDLRMVVAGRDYRRLPPMAEKVLCTLRVDDREGVPFFLARFRRRYAFLVGLTLSLIAVCVLSHFILTIDVSGNVQVPTAEIVTELRRAGVRVGVYGPGVDVNLAIKTVLLRMDDLSWLAVNLHGTRAEILVRESIPKPKLAEDETACGDVVADAPGIITHMEVLEGEPVYREGDTVAAGETVITGNMRMSGPEYSGVPDRWRQVRAAGWVYARTWRTMTAQIPLEASVKSYTGEEISRFSLCILGRRINFYRNSGISFEQYDKISSSQTLTLPGGQEMPLTFTRETTRAYQTQPAPLDRDVAEELLKTRLEEALRVALGAGEIISQDYTAVVRDGMLSVTLKAECSEEIGKFVPFAAEPSPAEGA